MKTKVDGLLIEDEFGIQRRVTSRCANGDFKRKYIRGLINQGVLTPTHGVVTLLGEVLDENARLRDALRLANQDLYDSEDTIADIEDLLMDYCNRRFERHF